jgi:NAD(P)-dependent dehydrogenase (short-subunit alcohol dehydrogenase family)
MRKVSGPERDAVPGQGHMAATAGATRLASFPASYRALVIGASGAIGAAFVRLLQADPRCAGVIGLHRRSQPPLDFDDEHSVGASISAKVGSIGDNRLGGWYSYRASKAALNMLVRTASIELRRTQPAAILVALHPGTVRSRLSAPFRGGELGRSPERAAAEMLAVIDRLQPADSGRFLSYDGTELPW